MDKFTPEQRSQMMSRVRNKNTEPEIAMRRILHASGYRFRLHAKNLPGHPDIVLPRYKTVIFVHGCFWHGHPKCRRATLPQTRPEFWREKIDRNQARDVKNGLLLRKLGYKVLTIWQCQLKNQATISRRLERALKKTPAAQR